MRFSLKPTFDTEIERALYIFNVLKIIVSLFIGISLSTLSGPVALLLTPFGEVSTLVVLLTVIFVFSAGMIFLLSSIQNTIIPYINQLIYNEVILKRVSEIDQVISGNEKLTLYKHGGTEITSDHLEEELRNKLLKEIRKELKSDIVVLYEPKSYTKLKKVLTK